MDNFDSMVGHVKAGCKNLDREFAGALLRPHGGGLRPMLEMNAGVSDVVEAARDAGRQLVRDGKMSAETLSTVSRELMSREDYIQVVNQSFQQQLDANKAKKKAPVS